MIKNFFLVSVGRGGGGCPWSPEGRSDPSELELQVFVSCLMERGSDLWPCDRVISTLIHMAVFAVFGDVNSEVPSICKLDFIKSK